MSVEWTQDGDGRYLVESKEHLLQIMNKGALGTDTGSVPTNYLQSSYLQTTDIDLVNDHASILPIGTSLTDVFKGEYDGNLHQIKNWAYAGSLDSVGLFGRCYGAKLERIRLSGVWTLSAPGNSGFLCGYQTLSTNRNIDGEFEAGTSFSGGLSSTKSSGALFGYITRGEVHGASVSGVIDFGVETGAGYRGGVAGLLSTDTTMTQCRNVASFPNPISGAYVGGLVGYTNSATMSQSLNAMVGSMNGATCGGVVGYCVASSQITSAVNSMVGNITVTTYGGGVIGYISIASGSGFTATRLLNYMQGDIVGSNAGGIAGYFRRQSDESDIIITKSVVAMQGTVQHSVRGIETFTPSTIEVTVDISFGMEYTSNDYASATMVVDDALLYHSDFADLPYVDMSGTDPEGTEYDWDFVYANIGGKYTEYTHLSAHTGQVSAPYSTDFDLAPENTTVYLTYANTDTDTIHHNDALTVVQTAATNTVVIVGPAAKDDFLFGDVYDITEAGDEVAASANDLFDTGDRVAINVNASPMTTTFVNRGGEISMAGTNALLLPFDPAVTDPQDATITLSDATSVAIDYDNTSGNIVVDGTTYSHGDYFVMDGQKVTVLDI